MLVFICRFNVASDLISLLYTIFMFFQVMLNVNLYSPFGDYNYGTIFNYGALTPIHLMPTVALPRAFCRIQCRPNYILDGVMIRPITCLAVRNNPGPSHQLGGGFCPPPLRQAPILLARIIHLRRCCKLHTSVQ